MEREWDGSARRRFGSWFKEVARLAAQVQEKEREGIKKGNLIALREWGASERGGAEDAAFAENVQTLATVVRDASLLGEEGGRVYEVLEAFERWIGDAEGVLERRAKEQPTSMNASAFVDDLGETWRTEVGALIRRLGGLERALVSLPLAKEGSSLADVIKIFEEFVKGMKEELGVVQGIERAVVEGERRWVDGALEGIDWGVGMEVG